MDDLEHMEHKLGLPVEADLPFSERLERIRTAMVVVIERADPVCESAWGPDADWHDKLLIQKEAEGSI